MYHYYFFGPRGFYDLLSCWHRNQSTSGGPIGYFRRFELFWGTVVFTQVTCPTGIKVKEQMSLQNPPFTSLGCSTTRLQGKKDRKTTY